MVIRFISAYIFIYIVLATSIMAEDSAFFTDTTIIKAKELLNKKTTEYLFNEINKNNINIIDEIFHDDYIEHNNIIDFPKNKIGIKKFLSYIEKLLPYHNHEIELIIAEDSKVAVYSTITGTYKDNISNQETKERHFKIKVTDIFRYQDNKITEHWGTGEYSSIYNIPNKNSQANNKNN